MTSPRQEHKTSPTTLSKDHYNIDKNKNIHVQFKNEFDF